MSKDKPLLTRKEYERLSELYHKDDPLMEWIARDSSIHGPKGVVYAYITEPSKGDEFWIPHAEWHQCVMLGSEGFDFVKWEDPKPHHIPSLLKEFEEYQLTVEQLHDLWKETRKEVKNVLEVAPMEMEEELLLTGKEYEKLSELYHKDDLLGAENHKMTVQQALVKLADMRKEYGNIMYEDTEGIVFIDGEPQNGVEVERQLARKTFQKAKDLSINIENLQRAIARANMEVFVQGYTIQEHIIRVKQMRKDISVFEQAFVGRARTDLANGIGVVKYEHLVSGKAEEHIKKLKEEAERISNMLDEQNMKNVLTVALVPID